MSVISGNQAWDFMAFDAVAATACVAIMMTLLTPSVLSLLISVGICWSISGPLVCRLTLPGGTVYDASDAMVTPCFSSCVLK